MHIHRLLRFPASLSPLLRSNFIHLFWDIGWWGLYVGTTAAFLSIYAARSGATPEQLGLLSALPALVGHSLGSVIAYELGVGFVPIRKKGKLPFSTVAETYELEYGSATVELHTDAVKTGDRVLLIDDLIATGGTMMAGRRLLEKLGAHVMEGAAIVDLPELGGSARLREAGLPLFTLVDFDGH